MPHWRVTWLIDVHAETAEDAATIAREVQRKPENSAAVFRVTNNPTVAGQLVSVSLNEERASNYYCYISPFCLVGDV